MGNSKYFKAASWDMLLKIITPAVSLIALAFIYYDPNLISILVCGSLIIIPPFFTVRGYRIENQKLIIQRLGWTTEFTIQELINVEFKPQALKGSWRTFGNGGLYGWIGSFWNNELGSFKAYATNRNKCVVLEFEKQTLLITPESPADFVPFLREYSKTI